MRHHGVPTRLLDWTESPLIGLYFAVSNPAHDGDDAALWAIHPYELNQEAGVDIIPGFDDDIELENYLPSRAAKGATSSPLAAIGVRNSPRMYAQKGMFTISHRDGIPLENVGAKKHIWRYVIPKNKKPQIREQLKIVRVDRLAIFPDLDSVAEVATEAFE